VRPKLIGSVLAGGCVRICRRGDAPIGGLAVLDYLHAATSTSSGPALAAALVIVLALQTRRIVDRCPLLAGTGIMEHDFSDTRCGQRARRNRATGTSVQRNGPQPRDEFAHALLSQIDKTIS